MNLFKEFYNQRFDNIIQAQILILIKRHFLRCWNAFKFLETSVFITSSSQRSLYLNIEQSVKSFVIIAQDIIQYLNVHTTQNWKESEDIKKMWNNMDKILKEIIQCSKSDFSNNDRVNIKFNIWKILNSLNLHEYLVGFLKHNQINLMILKSNLNIELE